MARIRTIKPEFWADEKLAVLPTVTRLVFLGLISQADDAGRLLDNVKLLDGLLFPYTDDTCREALEELAAAGRIVRYRSASGQPILQITGWEKHQKVDKPSKYVLAAPTDEDLASDSADSVAPSRDSRETVARQSRSDLGPRTPDPQKDANASSSSSAEPNVDPVREVFAYWRDRTGHTQATLTPDRQAKIKARLRRYTPEQLRKAIDGAAESAFHQGDNDRGTRYDFLETIFKTDAAAERLMQSQARNGHGATPVVVYD